MIFKILYKPVANRPFNKSVRVARITYVSIIGALQSEQRVNLRPWKSLLSRMVDDHDIRLFVEDDDFSTIGLVTVSY